MACGLPTISLVAECPWHVFLLRGVKPISWHTCLQIAAQHECPLQRLELQSQHSWRFAVLRPTPRVRLSNSRESEVRRSSKSSNSCWAHFLRNLAFISLQSQTKCVKQFHFTVTDMAWVVGKAARASGVALLTAASVVYDTSLQPISLKWLVKSRLA